jgi:hypothetical protein
MISCLLLGYTDASGAVGHHDLTSSAAHHITMLSPLPGPHNNLQQRNVPTPDGDLEASIPLDYGAQGISYVNLEKEYGSFDADEGSVVEENVHKQEELEEPRPANSLEQMHLLFIKKEEQHALMRKLYHEGKMLPKSDDIVWSLKQSLKEHIFPKVKLLSDREHDYLAPNFVDDDCTGQSRLVGDLNLPKTLEYKVCFWITYPSLVKNQIGYGLQAAERYNQY